MERKPMKYRECTLEGHGMQIKVIESAGKVSIQSNLDSFAVWNTNMVGFYDVVAGYVRNGWKHLTYKGILQ